MNYASENQLIAVAQSCDHFNSGGTANSKFSTGAENISCRVCKNWDGKKCVINVFDNVLTSLDQT
ncbi:MAG: hypothetical protein PWR27_791 [Petroclostridium sp.]|jgi:hypothetical protein|uniref:hypothetical protein n=1 Tax=Petroclostridium xylanilyticum TaxID=1792311 RepID=UPI000B98BA2E|nr:hypothetical protein [Petroclostridium xylanilyticum]MBZ4644991.1 hypothetical protein [Clostridia bacterium]MDK2810082.1 hypothetical protein [Petroclostridium sp.]